jgi:iron complex outermembrane recepter protein
MSTTSAAASAARHRASRVLNRAIRTVLRSSSLSVLIVGCALSSGAAFAAEQRTVEEIQAEVARLQEQLDKERQALAERAASEETGAPAAPAAAAPREDDALGKVTVRARNRLEPLKDVPLAISVVSGAELERLSAFDIDAITKRASNVSWNQGNQRTSSLSIRGIGRQGQTEAQDPSVGVVVDGVNYAYNALTSSFDFVDVDTVEVSRGPQGTLLGKNTSLGVINIATRKPSFTPSAEYGVTIGDWDTVQGRIAGGGPVIDDLIAWRGTLAVNKGQGDIVNRYNRDLTWQNKDRVYGKLQLLITPTDTLSIRIAGEKTPRGAETTNGRTTNVPTPQAYSNGTANNALSNEQRLSRRWFSQVSSYTVDGDYLYGGGDGSVNYDFAFPLVTGSNGALVDVSWTVGDFDLTSISAYKDYHFNAVNDEGTPFDVYRNAGGFWNDYKQWSQELRLASSIADVVDYQGGLFFLKVHNSSEYRREWGSDAGAWFANGLPTATTPTQYSRLDANAAGRYLMQSSLDGLKMAYNSPTGLQDIENESYAAFAQANWHLAEKLTLTTGARVTREERRNIGSTYIRDNGVAPELNPDVVNGVSLGGFSSNAGTGALLAGNTLAQLQVADLVANKYFGATVDAANPGAAYNGLTAAQRQQVADAKAIRRTAIGVVFPEREAEPFEATQYSFVVAPSYEINDQLTTYFSWQYGEKAGISQFVNGVSFLVPGEESSSYELGWKSVLLDRTLTLNVATFFTTIENYQQSVRVVDDYTTALNLAPGGNGQIAYVTATGAVPEVEAKGIEIDAFYAGLPYTTIRFSGSYNDAYYKRFANAAQPSENGFTGALAYRDVSDENLPGAYKYQFNTGVDVHYPIGRGLELIGSFNAAYNSKFNSDNSLSSYSWIEGKTLVDIAFGIGRINRSLSATVLVKNLFDDGTPLASTWNGYTPAHSRWVGLALSGKL